MNGVEDDPRLLAITAAIAAVLVYWCLTVRREKEDAPPRVKASFVETIKGLTGAQAPWFLLKKCRDLGNPLVFRITLPGQAGIYVVTDARVQREVFLDKTSEKPASFYQRFRVPGRELGIFHRETADPMWKAARKGTAHAFSAKEVGRMNDICFKWTERWVKESLEPQYIAKGRPFDPAKEMTRLTFMAIMESAFEYQATDHEFELYTQNVYKVLREFTFKQVSQPWRRKLYFLFPDAREAMHSAGIVKNFLIKVLQAYRANPEKSEQNTVIKLVENNPAYDSDNQKLSELGTFLLAGFDTTAYQLSSTLVLLAKHPEAAAKVQESISMDNNDKSRMTEYLSHVLTESRRLYPVAALGGTRMLSRDLTCGSHRVKKGSILMLPQILPHRDINVFGEDADVFRPERWDQPTKAMKESLLSFALGSRNCIGQALATAELASVLPRLMSSYKFSIVEEGEMDYFLTLKFKDTKLMASKLDCTS